MLQSCVSPSGEGVWVLKTYGRAEPQGAGRVRRECGRLADSCEKAGVCRVCVWGGRG